MTATEICKLILGRDNRIDNEHFDKEHQRMMNMDKFSLFLHTNISQETIMQMRTLPVINDNHLMISIISRGLDI